MEPTELTLTVGDTGQITATVEPDNATNKDVTWESSDDTVATVDENGEVTAVAEGEATITVTTEDGGFTDNVVITVVEEEEDPKPAFIADFNGIIADITVGGETVANAGIDADDNIEVTFVTDDADAIFEGAGVVVTALRDLAADGSTITINDETFTLNEELDISALAQAILGDEGVAGFLTSKTLTVGYTAAVVVEDGSFDLSGNLTFTLDVEDAQK